jgi:hypothetical protein
MIAAGFEEASHAFFGVETVETKKEKRIPPPIKSSEIQIILKYFL